MNLRKQARNRPCQVRLPGCDGGGETACLAHFRLAGICGVGMKPPDQIGAHACHNCHAIVDGRQILEGWDSRDIKLAHAEGVMRTIAVLSAEGVL